MGIPVFILGESGTGKSASLRNFNKDQIGLIKVIKKPLPFKSDLIELNTDDYGEIKAAIAGSKRNTIVIDDAQYLMANEFMRRSKEKGYEKFIDIGKNFWELINDITVKLPDEKIVYLLSHTETDAAGTIKVKTIGKLLDEKITVEGMFTIVLRSGVSDGRYLFSTQNNGSDTVKSPIGMFADKYIDNDLAEVDRIIREYYFPKKEEKKAVKDGVQTK